MSQQMPEGDGSGGEEFAEPMAIDDEEDVGPSGSSFHPERVSLVPEGSSSSHHSGLGADDALFGHGPGGPVPKGQRHGQAERLVDQDFFNDFPDDFDDEDLK